MKYQEVSEDSWHYKLQQSRTGGIGQNRCAYFWNTIRSLVSAVFFRKIWAVFTVGSLVLIYIFLVSNGVAEILYNEGVIGTKLVEDADYSSYRPDRSVIFVTAPYYIGISIATIIVSVPTVLALAATALGVILWGVSTVFKIGRGLNFIQLMFGALKDFKKKTCLPIKVVKK